MGSTWAKAEIEAVVVKRAAAMLVQAAASRRGDEGRVETVDSSRTCHRHGVARTGDTELTFRDKPEDRA